MISAHKENAYRLQIESLCSQLVRKQRFTMMVAHEMRNVLAPLASGVQLLTRDDSPTTIRVWPVVARQLGQLVRFVDDLVEIASSEEGGKMSLCIAAFDLREVIAAAIEVAQPMISAREHRLTVLEHSAKIIVDGDRCRLIQAASNLLINAAKFTPEGGEIRISLQREGLFAKICVRDTGIGITEDRLQKIFDAGAGGVRRPDVARGGLGLGLAVARQLVESHGGTLGAHSGGTGQGSEFVMRLPIAASR